MQSLAGGAFTAPLAFERAQLDRTVWRAVCDEPGSSVEQSAGADRDADGRDRGGGGGGAVNPLITRLTPAEPEPSDAM